MSLCLLLFLRFLFVYFCFWDLLQRIICIYDLVLSLSYSNAHELVNTKTLKNVRLGLFSLCAFQFLVFVLLSFCVCVCVCVVIVGYLLKLCYLRLIKFLFYFSWIFFSNYVTYAYRSDQVIFLSVGVISFHNIISVYHVLRSFSHLGGRSFLTAFWLTCK